MHMNNSAGKDYAGTVKKLENGKVVWTGQVNLLADRLLDPVKNKKPTVYFVDSMSDLFHESIPFDFIRKVWAVMALCPQHTFQVLTKRPDRMLEFGKSNAFEDVEREAESLVLNNPELFYEMQKFKDQQGSIKLPSDKLLPHLQKAGWYSNTTLVECGTEESGDYEKEHEFIYEGELPLPNVWLGTSVENQHAADERIPFLMRCSAAVRFLSCEPLIGPVDISNFVAHVAAKPVENQSSPPSLSGEGGREGEAWVICGGESGPGARPMHPSWARGLRDQCMAAGIPFFFKQWGEYLHIPDFGLDNDERAVIVCNNGDISNLKDEIDEGSNTRWLDMDPQIMIKIGKHRTGRILDGVFHEAMPVKKVEEPV